MLTTASMLADYGACLGSLAFQATPGRDLGPWFDVAVVTGAAA